MSFPFIHLLELISKKEAELNFSFIHGQKIKEKELVKELESPLTKYSNEFDSEFGFILERGIASKKHYDNIKSFYVAEKLAVYYNLVDKSVLCLKEDSDL